MTCDGITEMITKIGILEFLPEFINLNEKNKERFLMKLNALLTKTNITDSVSIKYSEANSLVLQLNYKNGGFITIRLTANNVIFDASIFSMTKVELKAATDEIQKYLEIASKELAIPLAVIEGRLNAAGMSTKKSMIRAGKKIRRVNVPSKMLKQIQKDKLNRRLKV